MDRIVAQHSGDEDEGEDTDGIIDVLGGGKQ